jgi:hypothetical protein
MMRSLALFGVLALLCAAASGCSYHAYDRDHYGHGSRWRSDYPRYHHGGYYGRHHGHYRHGYHHRYHRDHCD